MSPARPSFRFGLQARLMAAVLSLLVLLSTLSLWVVDRRMSAQTREDASLALTTARDYFVNALDNRAEALAARHRNLLNDSRLQRVIRLSDAPTTRAFLRDVLDELADETVALVLVPPESAAPVGARRDPAIDVDALVATASPALSAAAQTGFGTQLSAIAGRAFNLVALPVHVPEGGLAGVLLVAKELGQPALLGLRPPRTEVLLLSDHRVVASSLRDQAAETAALSLFDRASPAPVGEVRALLVGTEHFLALSGHHDLGPGRPGLDFVLFSSFEQRLLELERTRQTLLTLGLVGVALGALLVWFFLGRITRPLRALRDGAEAVGRGDFSHRIECDTQDECGALASEFNRMTERLQSSRAELERAMQMLRNTQNQLIQSEKLSAVGQFVAGVAHELNNPLTSVVGYAELLQGSAQDPAVNQRLDRIAQSAHRCHKIVQNLLGFARQHPPERKFVALHSNLEEVLEIMAYDLRTSDVEVVREFAPVLPHVVGDGHQLQQVFINILNNARHALESAQRPGRIVIRTRAVGSTVQIDFADNGPGIRPEHLAKLFDPFFTTKPTGKGTGLGLSLSYGLIQEHGGTIAAQSVFGHGATFTITLPVAAPDALAGQALRVAEGSAAEKPGVASRRILVVDDEPWILELAGELLRRAGHHVDLAHGGQEALDRLAESSFDLLVSDWKMPGLNGVRLFEQIRERHPALASRVIFMTGDVISENFQTFLRDNRLTHISKPFSLGEFDSAVARLVTGA